MLYFAYGSNMSTRRMGARIPSASLLGTGQLTEHRLLFHKDGLDDSGKCDALATGRSEDLVLGVLYRMDPSERGLLDDFEGPGYAAVQRRILTGNGHLDAFLYVATRTSTQVVPYDWYRAHVLHGAREHDFPEDYIEHHILTVSCKRDPDATRARRERAIHQASEIF